MRCEWLGLSFKVIDGGFGLREELYFGGKCWAALLFSGLFFEFFIYVVRVSFLFVRSIDKILSIAWGHLIMGVYEKKLTRLSSCLFLNSTFCFAFYFVSTARSWGLRGFYEKYSQARGFYLVYDGLFFCQVIGWRKNRKK